MNKRPGTFFHDYRKSVKVGLAKLQLGFIGPEDLGLTRKDNAILERYARSCRGDEISPEDRFLGQMVSLEINMQLALRSELGVLDKWLN